MYFGPEAFEAVTDPALARAVFERSVARVEIETHSYCNRRCSYCPNVTGDRLGANVRMDAALYARILSDLGAIGYHGNYVLSGYNEPLADRAILERIAEARAAMPQAQILTYTNGDYLTPAYLRELAAAGLSYMHISIHLMMGDVYSDAYVLRRLAEVAKRIGITPRVTTFTPGELIVAKFPFAGMEIESRAINYWHSGNNRGRLIEDMQAPASRSEPCHFPFSHFYVGYSGNIVPCCHIRSDRPEHEGYLIGNLNDYETIYQAFCSAAAAGWRRELVHERPKKSPCDTCVAPMLNEPEARAIFRHAADLYAPSPEKLPGGAGGG